MKKFVKILGILGLFFVVNSSFAKTVYDCSVLAVSDGYSKKNATLSVNKPWYRKDSVGFHWSEEFFSLDGEFNQRAKVSEVWTGSGPGPLDGALKKYKDQVVFYEFSYKLWFGDIEWAVSEDLYSRKNEGIVYIKHEDMGFGQKRTYSRLYWCKKQ